MSRAGRLLMTADAVGGVWCYACSLSGALGQRGWEVLLAVLGPRPGADQAAEAAGMAGVSLLPDTFPLDWAGADRPAMEAAAQALAELARRERCDLAQLNTPLLAAAGNWTVPRVGVAHGCVATWWHGARGSALDGDLAWHREMTAQGLAACEVLIAPSLSFAGDLARTYGITRRIERVYNGTHPPATQAVPEREPFAFTAGRLWDEAKNTAVMDRAARALSVPFLAAGAPHGPQGQAAPVEHLQALGHLSSEDLAEHLAARPVFVSAARFEPFGLAVLEAAQAGCPLVLSDIPSFRELWGGAASFVDADDAEGFAAAIDALCSDPELHRRMGAAARSRSRDYSLKTMTDEMLAHYAVAMAEQTTA